MPKGRLSLFANSSLMMRITDEPGQDAWADATIDVFAIYCEGGDGGD